MKHIEIAVWIAVAAPMLALFGVPASAHKVPNTTVHEVLASPKNEPTSLVLLPRVDGDP
jgi:hypothetical protein